MYNLFLINYCQYIYPLIPFKEQIGKIILHKYSTICAFCELKQKVLSTTL